jgi:hypothetical protein
LEIRKEKINENADIITMEELDKALKLAKNRKSPRLDNLPMELFKFGGKDLKVHILELFNNIADKIQIPQEWETGIITNIHKRGQKVNVKITEELHYCLQPIYKHNKKTK